MKGLMEVVKRIKEMESWIAKSGMETKEKTKVKNLLESIETVLDESRQDLMAVIDLISEAKYDGQAMEDALHKRKAEREKLLNALRQAEDAAHTPQVARFLD
jgi:uncharacterized protein YqgV (UPF0045/DUF77 family)